MCVGAVEAVVGGWGFVLEDVVDVVVDGGGAVVDAATVVDVDVNVDVDCGGGEAVTVVVVVVAVVVVGCAVAVDSIDDIIAPLVLMAAGVGMLDEIKGV